MTLHTAITTTFPFTTLFRSGNDFGQAVAIDSSGRIVVAGYSSNGSDYDFAVVRYNSNDRQNTTLNSRHRTTTPIGSWLDKSEAVAIDESGRIVVAGTSNSDP